MNRTGKVLLISFAALILVSFLVYKGCSHLFGVFKKGAKSLVDKEYKFSTDKHITFETIICETYTQWDTIESRLDQFFEKYPYFKVPDSLEVSQVRCENCEIMEKVIYFEEAPREFYIVSFDKDGANHINWIYQYHDGKEYEIATDTLPQQEKDRIKARLKKEMLDRVNWDLKNMYY